VLGSADTGNSAPRCCATPDGTTYAVWLHDNAGTKQLVYAKKPEQVDATLEDPLSAASADDATACDITAGKDTSSDDAAIIAWLNTAKSLNITYSTDTSTVTHSKNIDTSDADIKLFYINDTLYAAYAARGTTSDGISLWQPITNTTEAVASGTYNNLTGIAVSTLQKPVLAATDASDAYVFWYDGQQWRSATCPRGQGDTDARDDVALAAGPGGQVWVFWARGGKIEAALFNPVDGTFSDVVSVCEGVWVEATASVFVEGNVWLLVGFNDGSVIEAKWVTFDGLDVVEKQLADYTPPIDGKEVEGAGLGMTLEGEVLLMMVVGDEVRWMLWTPHAWSYPETVYTASPSKDPRYAFAWVDNSGIIHVAWEEKDPSSGYYQLFYANSSTDWQKESIPGVTGSYGCRYPYIVVPDNGYPIVVFFAYLSADRLYRDSYISIRTGTGWTTPAPVVDHSLFGFNVVRVNYVMLIPSTNDYLALLGLRDDQGKESVWFGYYDPNSTKITQVIQVSDPDLFASFPRMFAGTENSAHIIFYQREISAGLEGIDCYYVGVSPAGLPSSPINLSNSPGIFTYRYSVCALDKDTVWAIWQEDDTKDIWANNMLNGLWSSSPIQLLDLAAWSKSSTFVCHGQPFAAVNMTVDSAHFVGAVSLPNGTTKLMLSPPVDGIGWIHAGPPLPSDAPWITWDEASGTEKRIKVTVYR